MIDFSTELASLAGIVTIAIAATGAVKRILWRVPLMRDVPTWMYTALIATGLTLFASLVVGVLPIPEGGLWRLVLNGAINGALASGVREWFRERNTTIEASRLSNIEAEVEKGRNGLAILLAVSIGASSACLPALAAPDVSADTQTRVRMHGEKALGLIESSGLLVRDGMAIVVTLHEHGAISTTKAQAIRDAVRTANTEMQRIIQDIRTATREATVASLLKTAADVARRVASAFSGSGSAKADGFGIGLGALATAMEGAK